MLAKNTKGKLGKSQAKTLSSLVNLHFPEAVTNSLNDDRNNIYDDIDGKEILSEFKDMFAEYGIIGKASVVKLVNYIILDSASVAPHDDEAFSSRTGAKRVLLYVMNVDVSKEVSGDLGVTGEVYLHHSKKWTSLTEGDCIIFDPTVDHALINNNRTKLLAVWL
jgi:hypothetical protein